MRSTNGLTHLRKMGIGITTTLCGKTLGYWSPAGYLYPIEVDYYHKHTKYWHCPYCFEILVKGLEFISKEDMEL